MLTGPDEKGLTDFKNQDYLHFNSKSKMGGLEATDVRGAKQKRKLPRILRRLRT